MFLDGLFAESYHRIPGEFFISDLSFCVFSPASFDKIKCALVRN
jgi:hypothetical protein